MEPANPEWTSGHEKTTFRPGDTIWYAVLVQNPGPPVDAHFTWQGKHEDPEIGREIYFFENTVTVQTGPGWYYSPSTIPSDAPAGTYLNRVTVTIGGQEFVRESRFEVVAQETPTPTLTPTPTPTPAPTPPATPTATPAPTPTPTPEASVDLSIDSVSPVQVLEGQPLVKNKATAIKVIIRKRGSGTVNNVTVRANIASYATTRFHVAEPSNMRPRSYELIADSTTYPLKFAANETTKTIYFFSDGFTPTGSTFQVTATVDYLNTISESDENNNTEPSEPVRVYDVYVLSGLIH
jgi:hypothetical protein